MDAPLSLFIAMSLDGYIAGRNDDIDFLSMVEEPGEDYGYSEFTQSIDTVVMGRKTYEKVLSFGLEFPHRNRKCYVFSSSRTGTDDNVEFYSGPPDKLIEKIRGGTGKGIYCDGGANLVQQMINLDLMDQYIISIIPVILGSGIRLFEEASATIKLKLMYSRSYPSGLVQLCYRRKPQD